MVTGGEDAGASLPRCLRSQGPKVAVEEKEHVTAGAS